MDAAVFPMMDLFGNSSDSEGGGDAAGASFMRSFLDTGGSLLASCSTYLWKNWTFLCHPLLMLDIVDAICFHMCT
jgi:hypothetical protein